MTDFREITQHLNQWGGDDDRAGEALTPLVYDKLQVLSKTQNP